MSDQPAADGSGPSLWDFCVGIYRQPGVEAACLTLQDECGADIPLLLAVLWSARYGPSALDAATIAELDRLVAPWRDNVVRPLRQVRRWIKPVSMDAAAQALRMRIKADELAAERAQLAMLERAILQHGAIRSGRPAGNVLGGYAAFRNVQPDSAAWRHLERLAQELTDNLE